MLLLGLHSYGYITTMENSGTFDWFCYRRRKRLTKSHAYAVIQWICDYKTQAHGILNTTQFLFCWIRRADVLSTHKRSCKFHLIILHNSLFLVSNWIWVIQKVWSAIFGYKICKVLFYVHIHTYLCACTHVPFAVISPLSSM